MTELGIAGIIVAAVVAVGIWLRGYRAVTVMPGSIGLAFRDGKVQRHFGPGRHRLFDPFKRTLFFPIVTTPQTLASQRIEVISRDRFSFRLDVAAFLTVVDAAQFAEGSALQDSGSLMANPGLFGLAAAGTPGPFARLTPLLSAAVLKAVAAQTLEEILTEGDGWLAAVESDVADAVTGARIDGLKITALVLPPEVRKMFTEVERAKAEGLAALERARGEQAALRALANAARNLAGNPELAQLRMWQTMEQAKGAKTFVLGTAADAAMAKT